VTEVRQALGDRRGAGALVRTVHGFGYALRAEVGGGAPASLEAAGRLRLVAPGAVIDLVEGETVLGRESQAAVWLGDEAISRRHARITVAGMRATLEDLGSKNGTFLNGERLGSPRALHEGDEVRLGSHRFRFSGSAAGSTRTAD
jgi:hypothetical protein